VTVRRARPARLGPALRAALTWSMIGLLMGCAGLPDSGQSGPGRALVGFAREPLRVAPPTLPPGADPTAVVVGFLRAGTGFDGDHAVARTYLTSAAASGWSPARGAVIYPDDASLDIRVTGTGDRRRVVVAAPVWATISQDGELDLARPGSRAEHRFALVRDGTQWRIDGVDPGLGLWLARYGFDRSFAPVRILFRVTGTRALVPEIRWFGWTRVGLATAVVRAVLAGPSPYLATTATTGAPPGTNLAVDAVPTSGGVAKVDLSAAALQASPDQRSQLWAQLGSSLRQLPNVSDVEITVDGVPYNLNGAADPPAAGDLGFAEDVRVRGPALVLGAGRIWRIDAASDALVPGAGERFDDRPDASGLRAVAALGSPGVLVGVDRTGRTLLSQAAAAGRVVLGRAKDLIDPALDRSGWAWTADRAASGALLVAPAGAGAGVVSGQRPGLRALRPRWLAGRTVLALDVSREGSRMAVVSADAFGRVRLDVAGIARAPDDAPQGVGVARTTGRSLRDISDVSWADRTNLVVVAGAGPGTKRIYQLEVGGLVTALPPVAGPVQVQAGDGLRDVYAVTARGRVVVHSGNGWRDLGRGSSITVPE
jgi:hypothetical protein